jgi:ABC-type methionine transport system permease subunit
MAFFAVTMYRVVVLTSVGVPLTVQVVLSILKPAGSAGATVQLAIVLPVVVIPRFIQLILLLLSLKPMEQLQCGVPQILEAQVHPLVIVILRFIQILEPLVQVVLSILKPAGSAGATVQLAIVLPELLKVMSVMAEPIIATWSAPQDLFKQWRLCCP